MFPKPLLPLTLLAAMVLFADSASVAQNFWEPANALPIGIANSLVIASNGTIVDVNAGNVYLSSDNGTTWIAAKQSIPMEVTSLLKSPNGHLYAQDARNSNQVYRSTDNGLTWALYSDSIGFTNIDSSGNLIEGRATAVYVPQTRFQAAYYLDTLGIMISSDEGHSWKVTSLYAWTFPYNPGSAESINHLITFDVDKNNDIFAAISNGEIFKSSDRINWQLLPSDTLSDEVGTLVVTPAGNIIAGGNRLFRLDDTVWTKLNDSLTDQGNKAINSLVVDAKGAIFANIGYGWGYGWLVRSTDEGKTWVTLDPGLKDGMVEYNGLDTIPVCAVYSLATSPDGSRIIAGTPAGICESSDGGNNWIVISHGEQSLDLLTISKQGVIYTDAYTYGLSFSTDNGGSWFWNPNATGIAYNLVTAGGYIFEKAFKSGYFRSSDDGTNWNPVDSGFLPLDSTGYGYYYGLSTDECGHLFCFNYERNRIMYVSTDLGNSWHQSAFEVPADNNILFTSDRSCNIFASCGNGVFRSTDVGENWEQINSGLTDTVIYSFTVDSSGNIFAISDSSRIFYSIDDGNTWKYLSRLDSDSVGNQGAALLTDSRGSIYAATSVSGVFLSTDEGKSWNKIASGLGDSDIVSLVLSPNGYLFAATSAHGVYRSVNTTLDGVQSAPAPSSSISLTQNSPNPFTSSTDIAFTLPEPSYITLTLYDATGREVATLANGFMDAGEHDVPFQRGNTPSGVYFYRLESGSSSQTRAMVVEP